MKALCDQIRPQIIGTTVAEVLETNDLHFIFIFKSGIRLLICLKTPFLRFHLAESLPSNSFASRFSPPLIGALLENMELLHEDRILMLALKHKKHHYRFIVKLFSKGGNAFLLDDDTVLMCMRNEEPPLKPRQKPSCAEANAPVADITSSTVDKIYREKEFEQEKHAAIREMQMRCKRSLNRKEKAVAALQSCLEWENVHHEGLLLQANLYLIKPGMTEISVIDWQNDNKPCLIILDPQTLPSQEAAKRFLKSRKLRAGIPHAQEMITKADNEIEVQKKLLKQIEEAKTFEELDIRPKARSKPKEEIKSLPYREYISASGLKLWVGKSARDNDALTFRYANGSDWWIHVRDYPGSHVIIKVKKNQEPDPDALQDAMQLALYYSKAKNEGAAEVCITQCKHLLRLGKGRIGKVQISKSRTAMIRSDPNRINALRSRLPPENQGK